MSNLQQILRHVFGKDNLQEIPVETLEDYSREHPMFGPAQFLLARKYRDTGNALFEKQMSIAALYFHDPLWLHYQLSETGDGENAATANPATPAYAVSSWEPTSVSHDMIEELVNHQEEHPTTYQYTTNKISGRGEEESPIETGNLPDTVHEPATENAMVPVAELPVESVSETAEMSLSEELPATEAVMPGRENEGEGNVKKTDQEIDAPGTTVPVHPAFLPPGEKEEEKKFHFEPFHTVDYFASQGIKVSAEIREDDRLGKQMKSFTEWLKTMRRLPEAKVEAELERINDREIEKIAAHSLQENEIITEAMAEVYAKQGNFNRAMDIYRKLSLLNPAKSAYFAAKIEALNR